jgi:predicted Zn finger-like uncharacterized protein
VKFLCEQCKAKYQIADDKVVGKTVRMKCRKCGHLIEVRAAVTESSVASVPPAAPAAGPAPVAPRAPQKPAPARATSLSASLAATRSPASRPERPPGALAGAFKTNVQREEEISAPFDMSEISPGDDWYVAVNGVPVGPIRIAEVRRKAALGAVTEDSLVWQEGLDEWRPLRTFPELAAMVREAAAAGRTSMTPPPGDVRGTSMAPPPRTGSMRPASTMSPSPSASSRVVSPRPNQLSAPVARSNVVPITSRLATAERLDEQPTQIAPIPRPSPFTPPAETKASPATGAFPVAEPMVAASTAAVEASPTSKKGPPWIAIGMLAGFVAFGAVSAIYLFGPNGLLASHPTAPVASVDPSRGAPSPSVSAASAPTATAITVDSAAPPASAVAAAKGPGSLNGAGGANGSNRAAASGGAAPASTGRSLDLHGLSGSAIAPTDEMGSDGPKAAGQCFSEGQVSQVIGQHQVAIRRACWERNTSAKSSVNVSVSLTIGADGTAQGVSASGDDPSVAHCIENDVRNWHFPNMGCSQKIAVPFKFVRQ